MCVCVCVCVCAALPRRLFHTKTLGDARVLRSEYLRALLEPVLFTAESLSYTAYTSTYTPGCTLSESQHTHTHTGTRSHARTTFLRKLDGRGCKLLLLALSRDLIHQAKCTERIRDFFPGFFACHVVFPRNVCAAPVGETLSSIVAGAARAASSLATETLLCSLKRCCMPFHT